MGWNASAGSTSAKSVSHSLLEKVRNRDGGAWGRLTSLFTPIVYGWVRRGGVPEADAPDVTQDVFFEVARSVERFRRDRPGDTFTGWLRTIARRQAALYARTRGQEAGAVGGSEAHRLLEQLREPTPLDLELQGDDPDRAAVLRRGLELIRGDVAENTWAAFERVVMNGRPPADVAAELGMTLGAVYVAKSRVLKRLREELEGLL